MCSLLNDIHQFDNQIVTTDVHHCRKAFQVIVSVLEILI